MQTANRPRLALSQRYVRTPGKLPNVRAPKVALPPVDTHVRAKVRLHLWCCFIGGLVAIVLTFTTGEWFAVHIVPGVPAIPSAIANLVDRIYNR